jgi:serine/threonine-protein kinase
MGQVWQANDQVLRRDVAIKLLLDPDDPSTLRRFDEEARIAARLRHPGIAVVHDYGNYDSRPYIVMELLAGKQLQASLDDGKGLPMEHAVAFGIQLADALSYAHGEGIVHRDLKPANLMLEGGRLKICDFGIARDLSVGSLTRSGSILGTPSYMAPEQWRGAPAAAGADLYALGCILYAMVSGHPPFRADGLAALMGLHLTATPVSLRTDRPEVPASLDRLVLALLAKRPEDRPQDAATVASELTRIQRQIDPPPGKHRQRRAPMPLVAVGLAIVTVVGVGAWRLSASPAGPPKPPLRSAPS